MNWKRVVAWSGGWISGIAYEALKDNKPNNPTLLTFNIFLIGESGVGKDTILHILKDAKFESRIEPTKQLTIRKIVLPKFMLPNQYITIINTSGSSKNDDENIQARKELPSGNNTKYVYVFRVDKFFSDDNYQKRVKWDIINAKEQCNRDKNGWDLVIIGTHKDKCSVSDEQMQSLSVELSEKDRFRCGIIDLKLAENNCEKIQLLILFLLFSISEFQSLFFENFLEEQL